MIFHESIIPRLPDHDSLIDVFLKKLQFKAKLYPKYSSQKKKKSILLPNFLRISNTVLYLFVNKIFFWGRPRIENIIQ